MLNLVVASLFFVGTHFGLSAPQFRQGITSAFGERVFLVLYSLVALAGISWLIIAYQQAPYVELWGSLAIFRHLAAVMMIFSALLIACSLSQPNPTALGQGPDADTSSPAHGITRVTRHPFMWGVAVWSVVHLLANGDLASVLFFASFAVLAGVGTVVIDRKRARRGEPGWGVFLQVTSNLPLRAVAERRQTLQWREFGLVQVALALGLYVILIVVHPWLFGVSAVG